MVGDDFQAIYGFRASSPRHILDFRDVFPDARTVLLERNYRSTQEILDVANAVSAQDESGFPRRLWSDREGAVAAGARVPPRRGRAGAGRCASGCWPRARRRSSCARRRSCSAPDTTRPCWSSSSPAAGSRSSSTEGSATSTPRTSRTCSRCCGWWTTRPTSSPGFACCSCWTASARHARGGSCRRCAASTPPTGRPRARPRAASTGSARREQVPEGSRAHAASRVHRPAPRPLAAAAVPRARAWRGCARRSRRWSACATTTGRSGWGTWRSWRRRRGRRRSCAASSPSWRSIRPASSAALAGRPHLDEDYLVLSTVHSAKGLEWEAVHVISAYDGNFPADMSTSSQEGVAEERRLFYVALTRARRRLHVYVPAIFHHRPHGADDAHGLGQASRYLSPEVQRLFTTTRPPGPGRGPRSGRGAGPGRPRRRRPRCGSGCPCRPCSRPDGTELRWGRCPTRRPRRSSSATPGCSWTSRSAAASGIQPGEVVRIAAPECAKPLYVELNRAVWRAGGHVLGAYQPDDEPGPTSQRDFFELAERGADRLLPRALHARAGG